jgi:hypothetical protein
MASNGQTTTVISDDWISASKGRKKKFYKKNDIENHSHQKVHSPAILAGTLSVLLRTKFKNDFMPILSTDKKLDRTQIIDLVSDASSSQKEDVKISLDLLRKITWIIKVIEYYIKSNDFNCSDNTITRASISMIEYWLEHIGDIEDYSTTEQFLELFDYRYKRSKAFSEQKMRRPNTLSAYIDTEQIELDFDCMPTVFDIRNNIKLDIKHNYRQRGNIYELFNTETQSNPPTETPSWSDISRGPPIATKIAPEEQPRRVQIDFSANDSEDEFKIKIFEGEIQQDDNWPVFNLWTKFVYCINNYADTNIDIKDLFVKDLISGTLRRSLLRLVHPDKISHDLLPKKRSELLERAKNVGHELEKNLSDFIAVFNKYNEDITKIPRWVENFQYVSRTILSNTSFNRNAFSLIIDEQVKKLANDKVKKDIRNNNVMIALNNIINLLYNPTNVNIKRGGKPHGENKNIIRLVNDVLYLNSLKHNSVPVELISFIFGNNTDDYWNCNDIINSVPSLKYKFGEISQATFEAYFGKNILCITSPMLRDFILRMIRSNFGTSGSSNELIEYSYNIGVRFKYIDPDCSEDSIKHTIVYILVRFAFLAIYEKCDSPEFTLGMRSTTLSFAKIKSKLWEESQYQQFIQEYNLHIKQQKYNLVFGKIKNVFHKYKQGRINHLVRLFCIKFIRSSNLQKRNSIIGQAGLRRIKSCENTSTNNVEVDELEDWEKDWDNGTLELAMTKHFNSQELVLRENCTGFTEKRVYEIGTLTGNPRNVILKKQTAEYLNQHRTQSAKNIANFNYMKSCQDAEEEGLAPPPFDCDKEIKNAFDSQRINFGKRMMIRLNQREMIADLLGVNIDKIPQQNENETDDQFNSRLSRYEKWVFNTITKEFIDTMNNDRLKRIVDSGWNNFKMFDCKPPSVNPPVEFWCNYNPEYNIRLSVRSSKCRALTKCLEFFNNLKGGSKIENDEQINTLYSNLKRSYPNSVLIRPNCFDNFVKNINSIDNTPVMPVYNVGDCKVTFESKMRAFNRQSINYDEKSRGEYLNSLITIRKKKIAVRV